PAEKIDQLTEIVRVKRNGQSVYRKIPPVEVHLERAELDNRQGGRVLIILEPGRSYIHGLPVWKNKHRGVEFFMQLGLYRVPLGKSPSKFDGIPFQNDVYVEIGAVQEQVAHEAAHRICPEPQAFGQHAESPEHLNDVFRKDRK